MIIKNVTFISEISIFSKMIFFTFTSDKHIFERGPD